MSTDRDFYEYVLNDLFVDIEGISGRGMFGGYGFYKDGIFFGLIADGKLYFKVGQSNQKDYEQYGSKPFVYTAKKNKSVTMSYWEVPADILEDKEQLAEWVDNAVFEKASNQKITS